MPVYAQLPYFGFERLSGNAQLNGGAGWTSNHAFGFPESGFEDLSFVLNKVSNQRSGRRRRLIGFEWNQTEAEIFNRSLTDSKLEKGKTFPDEQESA